jgi:hypothetical protein
MHTRSRRIPLLSVIDEQDAPALSAEHLRGGQPGWPASDDRNFEI